MGFRKLEFQWGIKNNNQLLEIYVELDSLQDELMFLKRVIQWHTMLRYPMIWYGMEYIVCYGIYMLFYEICMLCYEIRMLCDVL